MCLGPVAPLTASVSAPAPTPEPAVTRWQTVSFLLPLTSCRLDKIEEKMFSVFVSFLVHIEKIYTIFKLYVSNLVIHAGEKDGALQKKNI